jgi:hypothetical protein
MYDEGDDVVCINTRAIVLIQSVYPLLGDNAYSGVLLPPVPLDAYNSCVFSRHRPLEVDRLHEHLPLIWSLQVILNPERKVLILPIIFTH